MKRGGRAGIEGRVNSGRSAKPSVGPGSEWARPRQRGGVVRFASLPVCAFGLITRMLNFS